jgi:crotonobetainyl-CoA:carnitine CoA-transferase CaiB-like acyl-CoA transferase
MTSVLAGPFAGSLLQRLGADVIKVEAPGTGDPYRGWGAAQSPHFAQFNAGKRSLAIDLRDDRGVPLLKRLLPQVDVVVHNSRPGRMERLGLSSSACLEVNPRLVWVGLTGFGTRGPLASRPAYDSIAASASGLFASLSPGDTRPAIGPALGDMASGLVVALGAVVGLMSRDRTGRGLAVETSMLEAIVTLIGDTYTYFLFHGQSLSEEERCAISQVFFVRGTDGRYVTVHCSTSEKFFRNLLSVVGREDLANDPRFSTYLDRRERYAELRDLIGPLFGGRSAAEWAAVLADADVPSSVVMTVDEVLAHPHVSGMGLFEDLGGLVPLMKTPWTFDGQRPDVDPVVPRVGEHSRQVLEPLLSPGELDTLIAEGVVGVEADRRAP